MNLFQEILVKGDLSYFQAKDLLRKCNSQPAALHFTFSLVGKPNESKWAVLARSSHLNKEFLRKPEDFIIQL